MWFSNLIENDFSMLFKYPVNLILYTVVQKERIFSNNCNFFILNFKQLC